MAISMKKTIFTIVLALLAALHGQAQAIDYQRADSLKVLSLLSGAPQKATTGELMLHFARQLRGIPYVAHTLETHAEEQLIVNLRQLDCTTYVETVLALTRCVEQGRKTFSNYCDNLRLIRYAQGRVAYTTRQHYFTYWAEQNKQKGMVSFVDTPATFFSSTQTVMTNWMTTHVKSYKMLAAHPAWLKAIGEMEQSISGRKYRYLPKGKLGNKTTLRDVIHDGDIIAIITSKKGLDTTHLGIAVWHSDGLHLLNASSIHKKVVEEPKTFYKYMQEHPSSIGIRVVRASPSTAAR